MDPVRGNDANPGTLEAPWRTLGFALSPSSPLGPGDTLFLRGGSYNETRLRTTKQGTAEAPITIRNAPGETPVIDGSVPEFRAVPNNAWEHVGPRNVYRSRATYPPHTAGGLFHSNDQWWALVGYQRMEDLVATTERFSYSGTPYYAGPGAYWNPTDQRIYIRLDPPDPAVVGHDAGLTHNTDPRRTALAVTAICDPACVGVQFFDGAAHQHWAGLTFRAHGVRVLMNGGPMHHMTFSDLTIDTSGDGLLIRGGASDVVIERLRFDGHLPPWIAWDDAKSGRGVAGSVVTGAVGIIAGAHHVTVSDSRIANVFDGVRPTGVGAPAGCGTQSITANVHHVAILDNEFVGIHDDAISLGSDAYETEIAYNTFVPVSKAVSKGGSGQSDQVGTVFIHHNVAVIEPFLQRRAMAPGGKAEKATHLVFGGHNVDCAGESPWKIYNNTLITRGMPANGNGIGHEYTGKLVLGRRPNWPEPHEVYNNLLVMTADTLIARRGHVDTGQEIYDGNLYWRGSASPRSNLFAFSFETEGRAYASLAAWRANRCPTCTRDWVPVTRAYYPPGWEASGVEADPRLDADFNPAAGSPAATGAVDLAAKGWPGYDGLRYRGALPPE